MKYLVLLSTLLLAACQSEEACYKSNDKKLSNAAILRGESFLLLDIYYNEATDACDYTVIGGSLYKL